MSEPLLIVDDLEVTFPGRTGVTRAVRNASLEDIEKVPGISGRTARGFEYDGE